MQIQACYSHSEPQEETRQRTEVTQKQHNKKMEGEKPNASNIIYLKLNNQVLELTVRGPDQALCASNWLGLHFCHFPLTKRQS